MDSFYEGLSYLRWAKRIWNLTIINDHIVEGFAMGGVGGGGMQRALTLSVIAETTCCLVGKEKCCSCTLAWEENFAVSSACIFVILSFGIYGRCSTWKELIINSAWRDCSLIIPTLENY